MPFRTGTLSATGSRMPPGPEGGSPCQPLPEPCFQGLVSFCCRCEIRRQERPGEMRDALAGRDEDLSGLLKRHPIICPISGSEYFPCLGTRVLLILNLPAHLHVMSEIRLFWGKGRNQTRFKASAISLMVLANLGPSAAEHQMFQSFSGSYPFLAIFFLARFIRVSQA